MKVGAIQNGEELLILVGLKTSFQCQFCWDNFAVDKVLIMKAQAG